MYNIPEMINSGEIKISRFGGTPKGIMYIKDGHHIFCIDIDFKNENIKCIQPFTSNYENYSDFKENMEYIAKSLDFCKYFEENLKNCIKEIKETISTKEEFKEVLDSLIIFIKELFKDSKTHYISSNIDGDDCDDCDADFVKNICNFSNFKIIFNTEKFINFNGIFNNVSYMNYSIGLHNTNEENLRILEIIKKDLDELIRR